MRWIERGPGLWEAHAVQNCPERRGYVGRESLHEVDVGRHVLSTVDEKAWAVSASPVEFGDDLAAGSASNEFAFDFGQLIDSLFTVLHLHVGGLLI